MTFRPHPRQAEFMREPARRIVFYADSITRWDGGVTTRVTRYARDFNLNFFARAAFRAGWRLYGETLRKRRGRR